MSALRKMNSVLGRRIGFEIRRTHRVPDQPAGRHRASPDPEVDFRPPVDPAVDRLLTAPVFVMSPVRSGSTLLRVLLDGHSQLHAPHELHIRRLTVGHTTRLAERSMEALGLTRGDLEHLLWDRVMHRELVRHGKAYLVEKTPSNAFAWRRIAACWPDARFVFLLRHPASVARSWHEAHATTWDVEQATADALRYLKATERARKGLPGITVRYEELTSSPEAVLRSVCTYLGVDWEPAMLDYADRNGPFSKGLGDWTEKIHTGRVQPGRPLPDASDVPECLVPLCVSWGYLDPSDGAADPAGAAGCAADPAGAPAAPAGEADPRTPAGQTDPRGPADPAGRTGRARPRGQSGPRGQAGPA